MAQITSGCNWSGSMLTCKGIPPGQHTLTLTAPAMSFVLELLERRNEVAGALAIDPGTRTMDIVQTAVSKGKRDAVGIPRGAILAWHTHPGKCPPRGADCSLDVPSDADMALVMEDCMQGTWAHTVFAHTGTFVVSLEPALRERLNALSGPSRKAAEKAIEKVFAKAHKDFEKRLQQGSIDLDRFRPEWMSLAKSQGFDVTFFPKGTLPKVTLVVT